MLLFLLLLLMDGGYGSVRRVLIQTSTAKHELRMLHMRFGSGWAECVAIWAGGGAKILAVRIAAFMTLFNRRAATPAIKGRPQQPPAHIC